MRQYLQAGLIDELHFALSPIVLGQGKAIGPFEAVGAAALRELFLHVGVEIRQFNQLFVSLRQEIADLRNLNARFSEKGDHTALDQTALELRTNRLREIKLELSQMLNRPDDPKVWWERARRGHLQA